MQNSSENVNFDHFPSMKINIQGVKKRKLLHQKLNYIVK